MKKSKISISLLLIMVATTTCNIGSASAFSLFGLKGKILLQTEKNGEAWYVNPKDNQRYYLGSPEDANIVAQKLGTGITNKDLEKIPVGISAADDTDTDGDGLSDILEKAIGTDKEKTDTDGDGYSDKTEIFNNYDPIGSKKLKTDDSFASKQAGKILLQVEKNGEAWYVNPTDKMRYYIGGTAKNLSSLIKNITLGVKENVIEKLNIGSLKKTADDKKVADQIEMIKEQIKNDQAKADEISKMEKELQIKSQKEKELSASTTEETEKKSIDQEKADKLMKMTTPVMKGIFGLLGSIFPFKKSTSTSSTTQTDSEIASEYSNKINLPSNTVILEAKIYTGKEIEYAIDESSHAGTMATVTVNYHDAPVALLLGSYEPTIWNIKWTEGTDIKAVIISGFHTQKIAGIPDGVPVVNSSYANKSEFGFFFGGSSEYTSDKISTSIFGRKADKPSDNMYEAENITLGDKLPDFPNVITSPNITLDSLYRRDLPRAGKFGIEDAIAAKMIRVSTQEEKDQWAAAYKKCLADTAQSGDVSNSFSSYTVLKNFVLPSGLWGVSPSTFIVPKDTPAPTGERGAAKILDLNDVKCDFTTLNYFY